MVGDVKWSNRTGVGGEGVALSLPEGSASGGGGLVMLWTPQVFRTYCSSENKWEKVGEALLDLPLPLIQNCNPHIQPPRTLQILSLLIHAKIGPSFLLREYFFLASVTITLNLSQEP